MSGDWKRGTASGPQRLQSDAWTAPDLSTTAPALDSDPVTGQAFPKVRIEHMIDTVVGSLTIRELEGWRGDFYKKSGACLGSTPHAITKVGLYPPSRRLFKSR